jgi:hypothetical protein
VLSKVGALLVFFLLLAHIWAIVQVFRSRESTGTKVLWAALIAFLPVLGLIIWFFAGPRGKGGWMRGLRVAVVAALPLVLACGVPAPSPRQVTERFWEALRTGDLAAAKACASAPSARLVDAMAEGRQIEEVLLGETLQSESSAIVRTSLVTSMAEEQLRTTFDTHLVRESEAWRVDVQATQREMTTAIFAASMRQIGEALGQGVQEFSEALEEGAAELSRAIREALEELEEELE